MLDINANKADPRETPDTADRLAICAECDQLKIKFRMRFCDQCGCIIAVLARIKSEQCPLGKW
jgi:membrane protease subunit (stomatin/prohibitin family)